MSKKTLMTLSLIGTALCGTNPSDVFAAEEMSTTLSRATVKTATTTENLNLRSKASTSGTILTTIPKGKTVTLLSEKNANGYYKVEYSGKTGYVSGSYLKTITTTTTTKTAKTTDNLNLRSKASTSGSILVTVPKGKTVTLLSEKDANGWYKAKYDGKTGYLSGAYLTSFSSSSSTSTDSGTSSTPKKLGQTLENLNLRSTASTSGSILTVIPKEQTITLLSAKSSSGWYKAEYNGKTGYVSASYIKELSSSTSTEPSTPSNQIPSEGQTTDNLNLRSKASTSGTVLAVIPKGQTVKVLADKDANGWYKVEYSGKTGYVSGSYLTITKYKEPELAVLWSGTINANDVRIFEKNSTTSKVLGYYQSGQKVDVVNHAGRGYQIKYNGGYAWIQEAYITKGSLANPTTLWTGEVLTATKIYSQTSTTSTTLKSLAQTAKVEVIEVTDQWLKVKNGTGYGFVPASAVRNLSIPNTLWTGKTTTALNVRATASASGTLLGTLSSGSPVEVIKEESNGWLQIKYKNSYGYVNGNYIQKDGVTEETKKTAYVYNLDGLQLNVRTGAGTSYDSIGKLSEGSTVIITGETGDWYQIDFNGQIGYVSKTYITFTKPGTHPDSNIDFNNAPRTGVVIDGVPTLNVREQATTDSSKLGTLTSGNEVTIRGRENDFYRIDYANGTGYVHKDYVGVVASQTNIKGRASYLTTDYAYSLADFAKLQQNHTSGTLSTITNYLNPGHSMHQDYLLQFLRIDQFRSFDVAGLNKHLLNKGVLHNQAQAFYDASKKYNIDPIFFVSQSIHETNWGISSLAQGITITEIADTSKPIKNSSGAIIDYARIPLDKPVTVYNLFGIGAQDHAPRLLGTTYAYKQGWTSVEKAIHGAAEFVSTNYINSSKYEQNTPFKIKYNHIASNQWHQYATTPWYAYEIGKYMHRFADLYDAGQEFLLDIPVYK